MSKKFIIKQLQEHADEMLYSLWTFSNRNTTTMERNIKQLQTFTRQDLERELSTMPLLAKHLKKVYSIDVINFLSLYFKMLSENYYCKTGKYSQSNDIKNNQEIIYTVLKQTLDILNENESTVVSATERTWRSLNANENNESDYASTENTDNESDSETHSTHSTHTHATESEEEDPSTEHLSTTIPNTNLSDINSLRSIRNQTGMNIKTHASLPPSAFSFKAGANDIKQLGRYQSKLNLRQPLPDDSVSQIFSRHQKKSQPQRHTRHPSMTQTMLSSAPPSGISNAKSNLSRLSRLSLHTTNISNSKTNFTQTTLGQQNNNFKDKKKYIDRFINMPDQSTISSRMTSSSSKFVRSQTHAPHDKGEYEDFNESVLETTGINEEEEEVSSPPSQHSAAQETIYTVAELSPRSVTQIHNDTQYSYNIQ